MKIYPLRHFRALEMAFKVNIYFLESGVGEIIITKPPHAFFYLHRDGNPEWKTVLFHKEKDGYQLLGMNCLGSKCVEYYFDNVPQYLDPIIQKENVVKTYTPYTNDQIVVSGGPLPPMSYNGWDVIGQVVDDYGKVRALTYEIKRPRRRDMIGTIYIGYYPLFPPYQGRIIPIVQPSIPSGTYTPDIVREIPWVKESYLIRPNQSSIFDEWKYTEKASRVLLIVALYMYSYSELSLEEFIESVVVDPDVIYDIAGIPNSLPPYPPSDMGTFFEDLIPGMVIEGYIMVPSDNVKNKIYNYLYASGRKKWVSSFPNYVVYSWDIRSHSQETVFLSQESALIATMVESYPLYSDTIIYSPTAYILKRSEYVYLVQMCRDMVHLRYVAYKWTKEKRNPGYMAEVDVDDNILPHIPTIDTIDPYVEAVSSMMDNGHLYLIIPINL